jgi:hypothetical protein
VEENQASTGKKLVFGADSVLTSKHSAIFILIICCLSQHPYLFENGNFLFFCLVTCIIVLALSYPFARLLVYSFFLGNYFFNFVLLVLI